MTKMHCSLLGGNLHCLRKRRTKSEGRHLATDSREMCLSTTKLQALPSTAPCDVRALQGCFLIHMQTCSHLPLCIFSWLHFFLNPCFQLLVLLQSVFLSSLMWIYNISCLLVPFPHSLSSFTCLLSSIALPKKILSLILTPPFLLTCCGFNHCFGFSSQWLAFSYRTERDFVTTVNQQRPNTFSSQFNCLCSSHVVLLTGLAMDCLLLQSKALQPDFSALKLTWQGMSELPHSHWWLELLKKKMLFRGKPLPKCSWGANRATLFYTMRNQTCSPQPGQNSW